MEIEDDISMNDLDDEPATYTLDMVGPSAAVKIAQYLKEKGCLSLDEDGHIIVNVEDMPDVVRTDLSASSREIMETISRIVKCSTDETTGFIKLESFENYPFVDFGNINTNHIGEIIRTKVDLVHIEDEKHTELRTPFMCQNNHITFNSFDRGDEMKPPAQCRFANDEDEECKSKPYRKMSDDDIKQIGHNVMRYSSSMISLTTQKIAMSNATVPDNDSRLMYGEIDQPLIGEFENRDTIEIVTRVLAKENEDSRDNDYYLHILGYEYPDSEKLTDERVEELEELSEEIDPVVDISSTVGKEYGIQDRGDGQSLRAKKAALFSAVKGHSDMNNSNIHTLLYGEAGSGKSKTSESVVEACNKGEIIDMQKASSAGIAGSNVKSDELGGQFILESGVLTQVSGGVCLVDEIDKVDRMSEQNIFSEPMERGVINISKTAKGSDLPADVSIIATANPDNNMYNRDAGLDGLKLQDHIRDRFDIITKLNAYHKQGYGGEDLEKRQEEVYESLEMQLDDPDLDIDRQTLSDYIQLAREQNPKFTDDAKKKVASKFIKIDKEFAETSNRVKDSLTNISTAIAKLELSDTVDEEHVERASEFYIECWNSVISGQ